jgi:hypothetical protein
MEKILILNNNDFFLKNDEIFGLKIEALAKELQKMPDKEFNLKLQIFPKTMLKKMVKIKKENFDYMTLAKLILKRQYTR